jgi:hypothetical protein
MIKCKYCGVYNMFGETHCAGCGASLDYSKVMALPNYVYRTKDGKEPELDLTPGGIVRLEKDEELEFIQNTWRYPLSFHDQVRKAYEKRMIERSQC